MPSRQMIGIDILASSEHVFLINERECLIGVLSPEAKPSGFRPDKTRTASLLNGFRNILQKARLLGGGTRVQIVRGRY